MTDNELTEDKAEELFRTLSNKQSSVIDFFRDIIISPSTTKTGNLSIDELGMPRLTQRGVLELALFTDKTFIDKGWNEYFTDLAEIQTKTSLSKNGTLINLAVTQKKELADMSPSEQKKKGGLFGFGGKKE